MNNFMALMAFLKWMFWMSLPVFWIAMVLKGIEEEEKKMGIAKTVDSSSSNDADSADYHSYSWDDDDDDYYD